MRYVILNKKKRKKMEEKEKGNEIIINKIDFYVFYYFKDN